MTRQLLIDRRGPLLRAALLVDGHLSDLHIDRNDRPGRIGAVLRGRVKRLAAGLDAAFIDIGDREPALLAATDVRPRPKRGEARIGQLLRAGQDVVVQIKADAHGAKGAVATMDVALPGRFLVHLPRGQGLHLSKRLGQGPDIVAFKARLRDLLPPPELGEGGWIVRAGALAASPDILAAEAETLWTDWRDARARAGGADPVLLAPPDAAGRALVEFGAGGLDAILVEGDDLFRLLRDRLRQSASDLADKLSLHRGPAPLFDLGDTDGAIAALSARMVPLPQGGSLVVERTEAMTVIDVNGGELGNPLATNLDAAREIARQLRLRNVGGVVVVDFINMARAAEREELTLAMSHAVADDPAGTHVYGLTRLGLMELTRARRGPSLADLLEGLPGSPPGPGVAAAPDSPP